jgi:hypothetical protein
MTIKYTSIFHSKALQNLPKLEFFGFENKPSDNPAGQRLISEMFLTFNFSEHSRRNS